MPSATEHVARISDSSNYEKFRRKNDEFKPGIDVIYGITKDGTAEVQSIRFDADKFSTEDAKKWLKDHDYKPLEFVAATGNKEDEDEKYWDDEDDNDDEDQEDGDDDEDEEEMGKAIANNKIEYKNVSFKVIEIKEVTIKGVKTGVIEGYAATYGDIDRGGDVILKGAFDECLKKYVADKRPIKMHFQHSIMDIIGGFPADKIIDDEKGLYCRGEINLEVQRGREAYALAKQGMLTDLSIGFSIDEDGFDFIRSADPKALPIRQLKKLTLWEVSMVGEPMNPNAKITEVKMSIRDVTQLVGAEKITKKSQLARILRKSKGFTKSAAEYLVNLICLESKEAKLEVKTNLADVVFNALHDLNKDIKNAATKKEQEKLVKDLQAIKNIIKK